MTRQYRTRTKHQNGASITSGSTSLTAGALLQGQGLSGATFPYTVAVYAQDTSGNLTSYEVMNVTGGTYPTLTVTRGIDGTTPVAHDTTHIIAQVVGTIDLNNFLQSGAAGLSQFSWLLKTANYSVTTADTGILADATSGNVSVTLPTAVGATQFYAIGRKDSGANTVTIATTSSQTIDGFASLPLVAQDQAVLLASDGANWFILSSYYPSPFTTKGDLLVADGSGIAQRLGVSGGSNGWALVLDSTQPLGVKWVALAGSSTLAGDTDVSISSPANLDVLQYLAADGKFHNEAAAFPRGKIGYAQITANITTTSLTAVDASGLSVTVTVGTRPLKLTFYSVFVSHTVDGANVFVNIFDVTGSAQVTEGIAEAPSASGGMALSVIAANLTPAAGSRTYKVQWWTGNAGTATLSAAATFPAFLLVEEM